MLRLAAMSWSARIKLAWPDCYPSVCSEYFSSSACV